MAEDRDVPTWGRDYDLERWTVGERDIAGNLIWEQRFPNDDEWEHIQILTINLDPYSLDGDFVNIEPDPDKPLDPWGRYDDLGQPDDWWDLDDLVGEIMDRYGIDF